MKAKDTVYWYSTERLSVTCLSEYSSILFETNENFRPK